VNIGWDNTHTDVSYPYLGGWRIADVLQYGQEKADSMRVCLCRPLSDDLLEELHDLKPHCNELWVAIAARDDRPKTHSGKHVKYKRRLYELGVGLMYVGKRTNKGLQAESWPNHHIGLLIDALIDHIHTINKHSETKHGKRE